MDSLSPSSEDFEKASNTATSVTPVDVTQLEDGVQRNSKVIFFSHLFEYFLAVYRSILTIAPFSYGKQ